MRKSKTRACTCVHVESFNWTQILSADVAGFTTCTGTRGTSLGFILEKVPPVGPRIESGDRLFVYLLLLLLFGIALFQNSLRNVSETFPLEVTMDWWSGNNWMMADIWSKAWLVEAAVSLCRRLAVPAGRGRRPSVLSVCDCLICRNVYGRLSCNPEVHPPLFYLIWATVNSARICCMFLWDRQ